MTVSLCDIIHNYCSTICQRFDGFDMIMVGRKFSEIEVCGLRMPKLETKVSTSAAWKMLSVIKKLKRDSPSTVRVVSLRYFAGNIDIYCYL